MAKRSTAQLLEEAQAAINRGDHAKATKLLRHAHKADASNEDVIRRLADSLVSSGKPADAVSLLRKATARKSGHTNLMPSLVAAEHAAGNIAEALAAAQDLSRIDPENPQSWFLLGRMQMSAADSPTAYRTLQKANRLAPEDLEIRGLLADAQMSTGQYPLPFDQAQEMVDRQPNLSRNHSRLGNGLRINNRFEEAIEAFDQALRLDRHNLEAVAGKAEVLESLGKTDEAIALVKPRILTGQISFLLLNCWARLCQRIKRPEDAIGAIENFISSGRASAWHRSNLLIKLGQLYEKVGRYDEAMQAWTIGNGLHKGRWDSNHHQRLIDELIESFSAQAMDRLPRSDFTSDQPVFIVGMYRSGTTLTEQILSAHPNIAGAGELGQMIALIQDIPERLGTDTHFPACVDELDSRHLTAMAESYCQYTHQMAENEARITDKMPMNYLNVGLISLMFPNAKILHCTRNPLDTCLSCYGNSFSSRMAYTADLTDLGTTYRQYRRIMDHWNSVNTVPIMEVNYETLVSDPEPLLKRIMLFLDMPWDDACMNFHETNRINATPSIDQVREPLYKGSMGRADKYGAKLDELKAALGID